MRKIFKRIASTVVALTLFAQFAVVSSAAASGGAASGGGASGGGGGMGSTVINSNIANKIGYAYGLVDPADEGVIIAAYHGAEELTDFDVSALMTDELVDKFGGDEVAAEAAVIKLMAGSLLAHYATDEADFSDTVQASMEAIADPFAEIFGSVDMDQWYDLMLLAREKAMDYVNNDDVNELPNGAEFRLIWATGDTLDNPTESIQGVVDSLDKLQVIVMKDMLADDDDEYKSEIGAAIESLGWTADAIVSTMRNAAAEVDGNHAAEYAIIKAACRTSVKVIYNAGEEEFGSSIEYTDNEIVLNVADTETSKTLIVAVMGNNVTNLIGFESSNEDLITIEPANENSDVMQLVINIAPDKNGYSDITIKRDPFRDNTSKSSEWLARFRMIVKYDIEKAAAPDWKTNETGVVEWNAVDNAVSYIVKLYKDGAEVGSKTVDNATECDLNSLINGAGEYTATVTAVGSLEDYEIGEESEKSGAYTVENVPQQVEKPTWKSGTQIIEWVKPSGTVTGYNIVLYKDGVEFDTAQAGADDLSYDWSGVIGDETGSYTVTVQAVNSAGNGAASAESEPLVVEPYYNISGYAMLQGIDVAKKNIYAPGTKSDTLYVKNDSSGIQISMEGYFAETNADGSYTIKDVPDGTYEATFSRKGYLSMTKTIKISGGVITAGLGTEEEPLILLYGDVDGVSGVSSFDSSELIRQYNDNSQYDAMLDVDGDGYIALSELSLFLSNAGLVQSNAYIQ